MKTTFVAFLDKADPPDHSFVDGMLVETLSKCRNVSVQLVLSRRRIFRAIKPYARGCALCHPVLLPRRNIGRFINFFVVLMFLAKLYWAQRSESTRIVLFVRNDPVLLFAACCSRRFADRVVFQSSFPHEKAAMSVKRWLALVLFHMSRHKIDVFLGVSVLGVKRLRALFPRGKTFFCVPLLPDRQFVLPRPRLTQSEGNPLRFIYCGSHAETRQLDEVLKGVVASIRRGRKIRAEFLFLGATQSDICRLSQVAGVSELMSKKIIAFEKPIPRKDVRSYLQWADVGLSLIPPLEIFQEASPTKLAEYLGSGLAVLASCGIPAQETLVREGEAGLVVEFKQDAICDGILQLLYDRKKVSHFGRNASRYAIKHLSYSAYLPLFLDGVLGLKSHE